MGFKRKVSRVEVGRVGRLRRGSLSAPCKVLDISESGARLESRLFVKNGDMLQLTIELDRGGILTCEVQAVHVRSPRLGAKIVSITPEDLKLLTHLLHDHVQVSGFRD